MFGITKKEIIMRVMAIVFGGFITLIFGLSLGYLQSREPVLQFVRNDSPPLKENNKITSIYFTSIYNVGNKEAEAVDCVIKIPKGKILSHGFTPLTIKHEIKENGDTATIHIDILNPNEAVAIQLLAASDTELPSKPEVSVRAKGVNGVEKGAPTTQQIGTTVWQLLSSFILMPLLVVISFTALIAWHEMTKFLGKRWELARNRFKVKIKIDNDERIKVTTIQGLGKSTDAVTVVPFGKHGIIGISFDDLKKMGDGTHLIDKYK